jgi:DNA invertase Pin-like site-specific DNA recombinase
MRANGRAVISRLIGYARVSTEEQGPIHSSTNYVLLAATRCARRTRPGLARQLHEIQAGETQMVVRLDRLARPVSHLVAVIKQLEAQCAHFRGLCDPIGHPGDKTNPPDRTPA